MIKRILKSNLFKNFSYLTLGEVVSKAIGFFVTIYVARVLGPDNFGKLGFAQAFTSYFGLIVNLGFDVYGAREIAKDKSKAKELLSNIVLMKFFLFIFAYALLFLVVSFLPKDAYTKKVILLYGLSLFTSVLAIDWFFQGFENFKIIAIGRIIRNVVYATFVLLFNCTCGYLTVTIVVIAILIAMSFQDLYYFYASKLNIVFLFFVNKSTLKKIFIQSLPFAFFILNVTIFHNTDTLLIGLIKSDEEVGYYNAAWRIGIQLPLTLLGILTYVMFPKFNSLHSIKYYNKKYKIVSLILGMSFLLFVPFSYKVITALYGAEYIPAANILIIFLISSFVLSLNGPYAQPLLGIGDEKFVAFQTFISMIINVLIDLLLIPKYSGLGAAIGLFCAYVVGTLLVYLRFKRRIQE